MYSFYPITKVLSKLWSFTHKFFRTMHWILTCQAVTPLNYSFNTKANVTLKWQKVRHKRTSFWTSDSLKVPRLLVNHPICTASILCQIWGVLPKHEFSLMIMWIPDHMSRNCSLSLTWPLSLPLFAVLYMLSIGKWMSCCIGLEWPIEWYFLWLHY